MNDCDICPYNDKKKDDPESDPDHPIVRGTHECIREEKGTEERYPYYITQ